MLDRVKIRDRRRQWRYAVRIRVDWETLKGRHSGWISDVSSMGLFVLSAGKVEDGQMVKVYLPLSDGRKVVFWGKIVNHTFDVGFALKLVSVTNAKQSLLNRLVNNLAKDRQSNLLQPA
jgi:hypothetical protein